MFWEKYTRCVFFNVSWNCVGLLKHLKVDNILCEKWEKGKRQHDGWVWGVSFAMNIDNIKANERGKWNQDDGGRPKSKRGADDKWWDGG